MYPNVVATIIGIRSGPSIYPLGGAKLSCYDRDSSPSFVTSLLLLSFFPTPGS